MSRSKQFVSDTRQASIDLIASIDRMRALRREWDALGYSGTLDAAGVFTGDNADVTEPDIAAVIGTTLDAIDGLLQTGHYTNLYRLR